MNQATIIIFVAMLVVVIIFVVTGISGDKNRYHYKSNPYNKKGGNKKNNVSDVWSEEEEE